MHGCICASCSFSLARTAIQLRRGNTCACSCKMNTAILVLRGPRVKSSINSAGWQWLRLPPCPLLLSRLLFSPYIIAALSLATGHHYNNSLTILGVVAAHGPRDCSHNPIFPQEVQNCNYTAGGHRTLPQHPAAHANTSSCP